MSLAKTIGALVLVGAIGAGAYGVIKNTNRALDKHNAIYEVEYFLDANRDGTLQPSEIKKFYDDTGVTPYTTKALETLPTKDFEKFIKEHHLSN